MNTALPFPPSAYAPPGHPVRVLRVCKYVAMPMRTAEDANRLRDAVLEDLRGEPQPDAIVIDMKRAGYLYGDARGALITIGKNARARGVPMHVRNVDRLMRAVLRETHLDTLIPLEEEVTP